MEFKHPVRITRLSIYKDTDHVFSRIMSTGGDDLEGVGFGDRHLLAGLEFDVFPFEYLGTGLPVGTHEMDGVIDTDADANARRDC